MTLSSGEILDEYQLNPNNEYNILRLMKMKNAPSSLFDAVVSKDLQDSSNIFDSFSLGGAKHYARRHPKLSLEVLEYYVNWATDNQDATYAIYYVLLNPNITGEMLDRIYDSVRIDVVPRESNFIINTKTEEEKNKLIQIQKENTLSYFAHHKNLSPRLLDIALNSQFANTRVTAAMNPNLSIEQVKKLLKDKSSKVRCEIVRNKTVPVPIRMTLLDPLLVGEKRLGGEYRVIQMLIRHLPEGAEKFRALEYLVSFNQGQGTRVLQAKMSKDKNELTRKAVDPSRTVRRTVAKNPSALPEHKIAVALMGNSNRSKLKNL